MANGQNDSQISQIRVNDFYGYTSPGNLSTCPWEPSLQSCPRPSWSHTGQGWISVWDEHCKSSQCTELPIRYSPGLTPFQGPIKCHFDAALLTTVFNFWLQTQQENLKFWSSLGFYNINFIWSNKACKPFASLINRLWQGGESGEKERSFSDEGDLIRCLWQRSRYPMRDRIWRMRPVNAPGESRFTAFPVTKSCSL